MIKHKRGVIAKRCAAGILFLNIYTCTMLYAQSDSIQIEEIIVVANKTSNSSTLIAPDAESLLATPGDVNDPLKALLSLPGITFGGGDLDEPIDTIWHTSSCKNSNEGMMRLCFKCLKVETTVGV